MMNTKKSITLMVCLSVAQIIGAAPEPLAAKGKHREKPPPPEIPNPTNATLILWTPAFLVYNVPASDWGDITGFGPIRFALQREPGQRTWAHCETKGYPATQVLGVSQEGDLLVGYGPCPGTNTAFWGFATVRPGRCDGSTETNAMIKNIYFLPTSYAMNNLSVNYPTAEEASAAQQERLTKLADSVGVTPSPFKQMPGGDVEVTLYEAPETLAKRARLYRELEEDKRPYSFAIQVTARHMGTSFETRIPIELLKRDLTTFDPPRQWPVVRADNSGVTWWNGKTWATNAWDKTANK